MWKYLKEVTILFMPSVPCNTNELNASSWYVEMSAECDEVHYNAGDVVTPKAPMPAAGVSDDWMILMDSA